jgi:phenylacetate-coenzyme A ligase PaaK-like adenylate-forming protein
MTTTTSTSSPSAQADRLRALAGEQLARDRWSRDRLLAFQAERLRALIGHAVAASPYHRDLLGPDAAGGDVPLQELPTLSKATLMDNFDRVVTDPRLRRAELEAHLAGPAPDRPYLGRYRLFSTAGTTGLRGLFVDDLDELAVWLGTCLRAWPPGAWGRGPGWPGSAPPARCTSPTSCMPCCWPASPQPPPGWP